MIDGKMTTVQVMKALRKLEKSWPDHLWLFAASGTLCLMENGDDGERMVLPGGGYDPDAMVARYPGVENDGGDW